MSKIVLDSTPNLSGNECPFLHYYRYDGGWVCDMSHKECPCVGGYYDSLFFEFTDCPYCTVKNNI